MHFITFPVFYFSVSTEALWTTMGVDLKHRSEKCKRYKSSGSHLDNSIRLHFFGRLGCVEYEGYKTGIRRHNKEVTKKIDTSCPE